jgi:hypothetical protein
LSGGKIVQADVDGVGVAVGTAVGIGVAGGFVGVAVAGGSGVGVRVAVGSGVGVRVAVGTRVGVRVAVGVGVAFLRGAASAVRTPQTPRVWPAKTRAPMRTALRNRIRKFRCNFGTSTSVREVAE